MSQQSRERIESLKPFLSLMIVIGTLLTVVFFKMEVRRMGYLLLKVAKLEKVEGDTKRKRALVIASLARPDRIEKLAKKELALAHVSKGRILQVAGNIILKGE